MPGANGHRKTIEFDRPPERVVSLVPSITESLFALGFGDSLVGCTDYCIHPAAGVSRLTRVGGTKNARVSDILALNPDLVIANKEENTPEIVLGLEEQRIKTWLLFPKTVREAVDDLWRLVGVYRSKEAAIRVETLEFAFEWAQAASASSPRTRVFCPIWQDQTAAGVLWWMTFNQHTYPGDLLHLLGGTNIFANRQRHYPLAADLGEAPREDPGERDTRYPRVTLDEVIAADPELILLPSEPFAYDATHRQQLLGLLASTSAARSEQVFLVDGSLLTWHGTRLGLALQQLSQFFSQTGG